MPKKDDLFDAVDSYREGSIKWRDVLKVLTARLTKTAGYRDWEKLCEIPLAAQQTDVLDGGVSVEAVFYFDSRRGDMPNRPKVLLDLLQGVCYKNDSQVYDAHFVRKLDKKNPRVEVVVTALEPELFTSTELARTEDMEF